MNIKKILWPALATAAAVLLMVWTIDSFGFAGPISAFLFNWIAMSWVAFVGQFYTLSFGPGYYEPKPFEQTGHIYELVGIRLFKQLVRRGPLTIFSPTLRLPKDKTAAALHNLDNEMRNAETGHVVILMVMLLLTGYPLLQGWFDTVAWMILFNILFNGYPIMLQRYNRIKLASLILQPSST